MMLQLQRLLQMQLHGSATVLGCRMLPELLYSFSTADWKRSRVSVSDVSQEQLEELLRRSFCIQPQSNECVSLPSLLLIALNRNSPACIEEVS